MNGEVIGSMIVFFVDVSEWNTDVGSPRTLKRDRQEQQQEVEEEEEEDWGRESRVEAADKSVDCHFVEGLTWKFVEFGITGPSTRGISMFTRRPLL